MVSWRRHMGVIIAVAANSFTWGGSLACLVGSFREHEYGALSCHRLKRRMLERSARLHSISDLDASGSRLVSLAPLKDQGS